MARAHGAPPDPGVFFKQATHLQTIHKRKNAQMTILLQNEIDPRMSYLCSSKGGRGWPSRELYVCRQVLCFGGVALKKSLANYLFEFFVSVLLHCFVIFSIPASFEVGQPVCAIPFSDGVFSDEDQLGLVRLSRWSQLTRTHCFVGLTRPHVVQNDQLHFRVHGKWAKQYTQGVGRGPRQGLAFTS